MGFYTGLLGAILSAIACAPSQTGTPPPIAAPPYPKRAPDAKLPKAEGLSSVIPAPGIDPVATPASEPREASGGAREFDHALPHLAPFYARLDELERGVAESSLRILWLGDSHTAADFLTDTVRRELWARFPSGGPGFVHVGLEGTRHGGVDTERAGKFRRQPVAPASQTRSEDGVFGYGGIRTIPRPGALFRLRSRTTGIGQITLTYRLDPGDALSVSINGKSQGLSSVQSGSVLEHSTWTLPPEDPKGPLRSLELVVQGQRGTPEIFGVDLESRSPGLILDTVGVNGARLGTPLAWEPVQYREEVARRTPSLIVISFGTNEAFDKRPPEIYREDLRRLVARLREAAPGASFWVHGPPDSRKLNGDENHRVLLITEVLEAAARELDCAFTSQAELMSYEGGFAGWQAHSPPWARNDNIHLTVDGYEELGHRLAEVLLGRLRNEKPPDAVREVSWGTLKGSPTGNFESWGWTRAQLGHGFNGSPGNALPIALHQRTEDPSRDTIGTNR